MRFAPELRQLGEPLDQPRHAVTGCSGNEQNGCHHPKKEGDNKSRCKGHDEEHGLKECPREKGNGDQRQDYRVVDADAELISRRCRRANVRVIDQR
jgi:hypothetical protein